MKDVRIGNDISVIWSLYSDQKPFLLDGLKISVYLKGMYGKTKIEDYTIKDNEIHWTFFGKDQKHTGKYSLTLVINEGAEGMVTTDVCDLVRLVSCTCQADGSDEDGVQTETIAVNSEVELLSGGFGRIDTALDPMSENAVSNAVITAEFGKVNEATSGLKTQIAEVKESIANISPAPMVSVTYSELVDLRNNGGLIAGMQYRITDYVTTTTQENTRSAGHPFDVIVTADSADKLNEVARAVFPTFNIERYKDAYSRTLSDKMVYIGLYEYNGKEYYLYEDESKALQMLVDFTEDVISVDDMMGYPVGYFYKIIPLFVRGDGDWTNNTTEWFKEDIVFKSNPNSTYFHDAGAKLEAWQIWYSLDNDVGRFAWADAENGKGVIYRMIDEWNNDLPYDFKNIMFKRYELNAPELYEASGRDEYWMVKLSENIRENFNAGCKAFIWSGIQEGTSRMWENDQGEIMSDPTGRSRFFYTFSYGSHNSLDSSLAGTCRDNVMLSSCRLPNNVFFSGGENYGNRFGSGCCNNSISFDCSYNTFGSDCCENCFEPAFYYNTFGNRCSHNSFGFSCQYNNFGTRFNYNSLGDGCTNNSFISDSEYNGLGMYCTYNTFDNGCTYNTLGNNCVRNSFGNGCTYISFRDIDGFAKFSYCTFDSGVHNFTIYYDDSNTGYESHRYIHAYSGVTGWEEIGEADRNHETCYALDKSGNVHEFCIMDFENS